MPRLLLSLLISTVTALAPLVVLARQATPPPAAPLAPDAPFTVAMNTATIEGSPVYVTAARPPGIRLSVVNGGVRNLANGSAHAATNAETQFLIAGAPNVRLLFTVAEGLYRVVAKRSAGIRSPDDLRGKRITTPRDTSAHYYLVRTLAAAGLRESDVTIVDLPRDQMAAGVVTGKADAIVMWEPEAEKAVLALGSNLTLFQDNRNYRELFSLYTTTEVLGDARRRQELVAFVRGLLESAERLKTRPADQFPIVSRSVNQTVDWVARSWPHHAFPMAVPADLLDVMTEEEQWVARNQQRVPRTREALAAFIEPGVLAEARRTATP
jgi:NitT/TauT family transport system substrate-binding protein